MNATLKTIGAEDVARIAFGDKWSPFSKKTICAAARRGEIRARKIGREWRFLEQEVHNWLTNRNQR